VSPEGRLLDQEAWTNEADSWLPSDDDREYIQSLMVGVTEPGKMAGWIAPPSAGIHQRPLDFDYVKL